MDSQIVCFDSNLEVCPVPGRKATDKVAKYKWRPLGEVGEFMWLDKKVLRVDRSYQREDEYRQKIIGIAADWKWESCGAISVMQREDGMFVVVDGQNRTLAAWNRSDITTLPCIVFRSRGITHEASSFIEMNTNRKPVSAYTKFRANLVAGDQSATEILSVLKENLIDLKPDGHAPGTITCIAACQNIYAQSPSRFKTVIKLSSGLAAAESTGISLVLVRGLAILDRKIQGGLQNQRLVERIMQIGALGLVDAARKMSYRAGKGGEAVWAEGMLEIINRKRGAKFSMQS
jgi:hypothetical protein